MLKHLYNVAHSLIREHLTKPAKRSDKWPLTRRHFLESQPTCEACGGNSRLQVHHKVPFHEDPSKELDPTNLLALCMGPKECHLEIGHGGSFKQFNPHAESDAVEALANPEKFTDIVARAEANRKPNEPEVK